MDPSQRARSERFQQRDAEESRQRKGHDGQGFGQARNKCADIPPTRGNRILPRSIQKCVGFSYGRSLTTSPTNFVNSRTSSSVVSNEHIHRTTDSSSLHT